MSANNKNQNLTNLASPKIGTKVIEVSDDFFGEASLGFHFKVELKIL